MINVSHSVDIAKDKKGESSVITEKTLSPRSNIKSECCD